MHSLKSTVILYAPDGSVIFDTTTENDPEKVFGLVRAVGELDRIFLEVLEVPCPVKIVVDTQWTMA